MNIYFSKETFIHTNMINIKAIAIYLMLADTSQYAYSLSSITTTIPSSSEASTPNLVIPENATSGLPPWLPDLDNMTRPPRPLPDDNVTLPPRSSTDRVTTVLTTNPKFTTEPSASIGLINPIRYVPMGAFLGIIMY